MKKLLVLFVFASLSASSYAQSASDKPLYVELGYSTVKIKDSDVPGLSFDNAVVTGIVGYKFHPNLAGEVFLASGVSDDSVTYLGQRITSEVKGSYGLFLKPTFMVTNQLELFGRLGFTRSEVEYTVVTTRRSETETSFAYGAGLNYHFTNTVYGQAAYMSYYDKNGTNARGLLLGLGIKF